MDGVLWHGNKPLPGLHAFFAFLRERGIQFVLATNNSSRLAEQYAQKMAGFGVTVRPQDILTSSQATAAYLMTVATPGTRVYHIGEVGVARSLEHAGFVLSEYGAEYVVVGWDRHLTWEKLATASLLIYGGAKLVSTNPDTSYPEERGIVPGNGAQVAALEVATGQKAQTIGKPEPLMYQEAMRRMGANAQETAVVGDRLETDVLGGVRAGISTILVLSGIGSQAQVDASPFKPDLVCSGIEALTKIWQVELQAG
jgi:4-nitrophenyl phosphatase